MLGKKISRHLKTMCRTEIALKYLASSIALQRLVNLSANTSVNNWKRNEIGACACLHVPISLDSFLKPTIFSQNLPLQNSTRPLWSLSTKLLLSPHFASRFPRVLIEKAMKKEKSSDSFAWHKNGNHYQFYWLFVFKVFLYPIHPHPTSSFLALQSA